MNCNNEDCWFYEDACMFNCAKAFGDEEIVEECQNRQIKEVRLWKGMKENNH